MRFPSLRSYFRSVRQRRTRRSVTFEVLEDRMAPAIFNIANGDVPGLIAAINTANTNSQADTINLAAGGVYMIPPGSNPPTDPNNIGLPFISLDGSAANSLTINGNGATFQAQGNSFRIIWVTTGVLIANNLTLQNASIPPSCCGGAGMVVGTSTTAPANSTGTVNLTNVTFSNNTANNAGGAMYMYGPNSSTTLTNCTITGNKVQNGGAAGGTIVIAGPGDTLTINGTTISTNTSAGQSAGITVNGTNEVVNITSSTISGNSAATTGGALVVTGTGNHVTVTGSTISGNTANGGGNAAGAIFENGTNSVLAFTNSVISGNTEGGAGVAGAMSIYGSGAQVTFTNSILDNNQGGAPARGGVQINSASATLTFTNCTMTNNRGGGNGGFLGNNGGTVNINNSTITGNVNTNVGGAMQINGASAVVVIRDSTVTNNTGNVYCGGVNINAGTLTIVNSVVAGNIAPSNPDVNSTIGTPAVTFSLIGNTAGNNVTATGANGNIINVAAGVGTLKNNGGLMVGAPATLLPLQTVALLAGSPAIDKGSNAAIPAGTTTDERGAGFSRIINNTVDMGAYEFQPPATTTTVTSSLNPANLGQTVTFTATVTVNAPGSNPSQGTVTFIDNGAALGTVTLIGGMASFSTAALTAGSHTITAQFNGFSQGDYILNASSAMLTEVINNPAPPPPPPPPPRPPKGPPIIVTGTDIGGAPEVKVFDAHTLTLKFDFFAYPTNFTGGVRVAVGDVNGDGIPDIITGDGPGGPPEVKIFDGLTGVLIQDYTPFTPFFFGGIYVASGDVNNDGFADVIVGADTGGAPNVKSFSGRDGSLQYNFFAYKSSFTGGVRVAAGDVNGDGFADIITVTGPGSPPRGSRVQRVRRGDDSGLFRPGPDLQGRGICSRRQPERHGVGQRHCRRRPRHHPQGHGTEQRLPGLSHPLQSRRAHRRRARPQRRRPRRDPHRGRYLHADRQPDPGSARPAERRARGSRGH